MARPRILDFIDRQSEDLTKLEDRQVAAFLKAYEDARRELREQLDTMVKTGLDKKTPFTAQHLRVMLAQTETGITALQRRLGKVLVDASTQTRQRSLQDLLKTIAAAEPEFTDAGGRIEQRALQRLVTPDGLLLHEHSIQRYGRDLVSKIQAELVTAVTRGSTLDQVVQRIAGTDSVLTGMRARAELIARMELNRAYNEGHQSSLEEASAVLDADGDHEGDPFVKRADEFRDRRNHPFSRALDGKTAPVTQPAGDKRVPGEWAVPDFEVQAQAAAMGRPAKGIVWRKEGSTWKGSMHPAHYNDRGRMTSWRASWAENLEDLPKAPERKKYTYKARRVESPKLRKETQRRGHEDTPRSPSLGERTTLANLLSFEDPPIPGTQGVLLDDIDPKSWFDGLKFNPDAVPLKVRQDTWNIARKLETEVALLHENGQVRIVSGTNDSTTIGSPRIGKHFICHVHISGSSELSGADKDWMNRYVALVQDAHPEILDGDLASMLIFGPGETDWLPYYGHPT